MEETAPQQVVSEQKTCIWSILSIIFAFVFPLLGLIFGIVALVKISHDSNLKGKGLAIAGLIIGALLTLIIPILVALGAIAYFGVLNPEAFLPRTCLIGSGFSCNDFKVSADGSWSILVQNNIGSTISAVDLDLSEITSGGTGAGSCTPKTLDAGKTTTCSGAAGSITAGKKEERVIATIDFDYTRNGLSHTSTGNLITRME